MHEAVHKLDPHIKVIIVSAMMDEEIVQKAKKAGISGYIQKPVDSEEITLLIRRVMADEELFVELGGLYYNAFRESLDHRFESIFQGGSIIQRRKDDQRRKNLQGFFGGDGDHWEIRWENAPGHVC